MSVIGSLCIGLTPVLAVTGLDYSMIVGNPVGLWSVAEVFGFQPKKIKEDSSGTEYVCDTVTEIYPSPIGPMSGLYVLFQPNKYCYQAGFAQCMDLPTGMTAQQFSKQAQSRFEEKYGLASPGGTMPQTVSAKRYDIDSSCVLELNISVAPDNPKQVLVMIAYLPK